MGGATSKTLTRLFPELDAQRLAIRMQPCFRRTVDRSDGQRHKGQTGGDVHNGCGRLAQQVWQELLDHPYGPNQISVDLATDILQATTVVSKQVDFAHDSGIVDQYVQPRKLSNHGIAKQRN